MFSTMPILYNCCKYVFQSFLCPFLHYLVPVHCSCDGFKKLFKITACVFYISIPIYTYLDNVEMCRVDDGIDGKPSPSVSEWQCSCNSDICSQLLCSHNWSCSCNISNF